MSTEQFPDPIENSYPPTQAVHYPVYMDLPNIPPPPPVLPPKRPWFPWVISAILIAIVLVGSTAFITTIVVSRNLQTNRQGSSTSSSPTVAPTLLNLPSAIQLVKAYHPSQQYASVIWKQEASPSGYDLYPYPQSYAEFDICFGAGGSGCATVLYTLAIYPDAATIVQLTPQTRDYSSFEWNAILGHCILQAQNDVHSDFLGVESDFSQIYPC